MTKLKKAEDMTPDEINAELDTLEEWQSGLIQRMAELRRRLALDACPYKEGEVLVSIHGERARIESISATQGPRGKYKLCGVYLKADGSPARNPGRDNTRPRACQFYEWDKWQRPTT